MARVEAEEVVRKGGAGDGDGERLWGEWPGEWSITTSVVTAMAWGLGVGIWVVS